MYTGSRIHGCLGQKKIRFFFQHSQCSRIHGFTDVFTCHQHLHINTNSRIHGFTRVSQIDRTSLDSPKWCIFPFLFIIQNDMQKISIIGECLKVAQTRGSLAHLRPFLAQNLQKGVFCRIVS